MVTYEDIIKDAYGNRMFLTVTEVSDLTGLSNSAIYQMISEGAFPSVELGQRAKRVPVPDLIAWAKNPRIKTAPKTKEKAALVLGTASSSSWRSKI